MFTQICDMVTRIVHFFKSNQSLKEGLMYCFDTSSKEPLWSFKPHDSSCTSKKLLF